MKIQTSDKVEIDSTGTVTCRPISSAIWAGKWAIDLALTRLALPDALLVGTALLSGSEAIITNDERWSRRLAPLFPRLRWIYLGG